MHTEKRIALMTLATLEANGWTVSHIAGSDFREKASNPNEAAAWVDEIDEPFNVIVTDGEVRSFVTLVPGNGPDVIANYSDRLDRIIENVFA